jgi:hypothetical protein
LNKSRTCRQSSAATGLKLALREIALAIPRRRIRRKVNIVVVPFRCEVPNRLGAAPSKW